MPLLVNLRHLANDSLSLKGKVTLEELEMTINDELIHSESPLEYDISVEKMNDSLLLQGRLSLVLKCECARCLKPFNYSVDLPHWAGHVPLEGEEKAPVINDCVDLTPYVREDILLEFPQHPLCDPNCRGLQKVKTGKTKPEAKSPTQDVSSAWSELDKLKL